MKFNIFSSKDQTFGSKKQDSLYGSIMSERIGKRHSTEMAAKRQTVGEYPSVAQTESRQLPGVFATADQAAAVAGSTAGAGVTGYSM